MLLPVLWHVVALLRIFASRLRYPMDIDWMEGGELYHGYRVMHLESVWGSPDQGFVPFGYPPLHAVVLGLVGRVTGLDYWTGRLVSIVFVVAACGVLLQQMLRHADRNLTGRLLAVLGVGMALAAYPVTGGWYDMIRNDTLAIALPLAAAALVSDGERLDGRWRWVTVALLLVATIYAKQTGAFFVAWILLFALVTDRRTGIRIGLLAGGVTVGLFLVAQLLTDGWFFTWISLMGKQTVDLERLRMAARIVWDFAPYLVLLPVLPLVLWQQGWLSRRGVLWLGMLVAAVPASLLPFVKDGGFNNNLLPIVFLAGPVTVMLVIDLLRGLDQAQHARAHLVAQGAALAAAALFLVVQRYPIDDYRPTEQQWQSAEDLNAYVRDLDGEVLMPEQPFVATRNGHTVSQIHGAAHYDAGTAGIEGTGMDRFIAASDARWVLISPREEGIVRAAGWSGEPRVIPPESWTLIGRIVAPTHLYER